MHDFVIIVRSIWLIYLFCFFCFVLFTCRLNRVNPKQKKKKRIENCFVINVLSSAFKITIFNLLLFFFFSRNYIILSLFLTKLLNSNLQKRMNWILFEISTDNKEPNKQADMKWIGWNKNAYSFSIKIHRKLNA